MSWIIHGISVALSFDKKKYRHACQDQSRHLSPLVVSCDGVLGNEAKVVLQTFHQEIRKVLSWSPGWVLQLCIDNASPRAEWAIILSGKMEPASACSTIKPSGYSCRSMKRTSISTSWQVAPLLMRPRSQQSLLEIPIRVQVIRALDGWTSWFCLFIWTGAKVLAEA